MANKLYQIIRDVETLKTAGRQSDANVLFAGALVRLLGVQSVTAEQLDYASWQNLLDNAFVEVDEDAYFDLLNIGSQYGAHTCIPVPMLAEWLRRPLYTAVQYGALPSIKRLEHSRQTIISPVAEAVYSGSAMMAGVLLGRHVIPGLSVGDAEPAVGNDPTAEPGPPWDAG